MAGSGNRSAHDRMVVVTEKTTALTRARSVCASRGRMEHRMRPCAKEQGKSGFHSLTSPA